MSTYNSSLKPKRKNRPVAKKIAKLSSGKDPAKSINTHSRFLSKTDTNSNPEKDKQTMITRNRITTQTGIFNMAKMSKTVSRGPLSTHIDSSMMDQDPQNCDSTMISRVINQSQLLENQDHSLMDISKPVTPDTGKLPLRRCAKLDSLHNQFNQNFPVPAKLVQPAASPEQPVNHEIPFKEIEHNLLHGINSEDFLKRSNTLSLIKRDLHATIKRNIPQEIYLQFFKKSAPAQSQPTPTLYEKKVMPLQPSHLANLPKSQQDRKQSEWTVLMGTFSSQEDEDNGLAFKAESKANMMDTDVSLSRPIVGYIGGSKPDYLDSPAPVTMYPHKMF